MDKILSDALVHLSELKDVYRPDFDLEKYDSSYQVILNYLTTSDESVARELITEMLSFLNNKNSDTGLEAINLIPSTLFDLISEEKSLTVSAITDIVVRMAPYFRYQADNWISEVYCYGYLLYAVRKGYSLEAIKEGIFGNPTNNIDDFLEILKQLRDSNDHWYEGSKKLNAIIELIEEK
jgi:hypothetical protein